MITNRMMWAKVCIHNVSLAHFARLEDTMITYHLSHIAFIHFRMFNPRWALLQTVSLELKELSHQYLLCVIRFYLWVLIYQIYFSYIL